MPIAFSDIQNHWAQAPIAAPVRRSLVNGYPDGSFRPDATITRADPQASVRSTTPPLLSGTPPAPPAPPASPASPASPAYSQAGWLKAPVR